MFASIELDKNKSNTRREHCQTIASSVAPSCSVLRKSSDSAACTDNAAVKGEDLLFRVEERSLAAAIALVKSCSVLRRLN